MLTIITRITYYSAERNTFLGLWPFRRNFSEPLANLPSRSKNRYTLRNSYALRGISARWYGDLPLNLARYSRDLPLHGKHANLLRASLSFFGGLAKFGKSARPAEIQGVG